MFQFPIGALFLQAFVFVLLTRKLMTTARVLTEEESGGDYTGKFKICGSMAQFECVAIGLTCDPKTTDTDDEGMTPVCESGTFCNPKTKICDCADEDNWTRTWDGKKCALRPGSRCATGTDDQGDDDHQCPSTMDCVKKVNTGHTVKDCEGLQDASCYEAYDLGYRCVCKKGKKCDTKKVNIPAPTKPKTKTGEKVRG